MIHSNTILALTATTTALAAGLFYSYSCSVSPGLGRLADAEYLSAMQQINRAILNPVFFASFMGTLLLLPLSTFLHYGKTLTPAFWLLAGASCVYFVGVFGVTVAGNVPLNNALDVFDIQSANAESLKHQRSLFENRWNMLNHVRTISVIVTVVLVIIACLNSNRQLGNLPLKDGA